MAQKYFIYFSCLFYNTHLDQTPTYYYTEVNRIKAIWFANQWQIDTVIGIRSFIDNNFDKELNLEYLSRVRYTSKFHLLRLFQKYYGLTPAQYLTAKRIEESKKSLRAGISVSDTCFAVGYASPSSFSTLFKNKTGSSPLEFQKRAILTK